MEFNIIKEELSLDEYFEFVHRVTLFCFNEKKDVDGNTILTFSSSFKNIQIKACFLEYYTDYKNKGVRIHDDYPTYISFSIEDYLDKINEIQFASLLDDINSDIEFKKQMLLLQYQQNPNSMPSIIPQPKATVKPQDHKKPIKKLGI
jgi:hypothetical protein